MIPLNKILEHTEKHPYKKAVVEDKTTITWEDYATIVTRGIATLIERFDLNEFSRVVYISRNRTDLLMLYSVFSSFRIPFVGLDYTASNEQMLHCIREIGASHVVYTNEFRETVDALHAQYPFYPMSLETLDLLQLPNRSLPTDWQSYKKEAFEAFGFTSGTSGFPKVVYRTQSFEARRFATLTSLYGFESDDRFLITLPFYHASTLGWTRLFLNLGGTVHVGDPHRPEKIFSDLIIHEINCFLIVPHLLNTIVQLSENTKIHPDFVKFIIVGGKHFPVDLKYRAMKVFGEVLNEYYGTTETGINTLAGPRDLLSYPHSSGTLMEGSDIVILDESNQPLPSHQTGRIAIHSYQNMDRYVSAKTEKCVLDGKDYIITSDIGKLDHEGRLYLMARSDLSVTDQEVKVYHMENIVRKISGVEDVFIYSEAGQQIIVVELHPNTNEDQVLEGIRHILNHEDIGEAQIMKVSHIPYSLSGKVKIPSLKRLINEQNAEFAGR